MAITEFVLPREGAAAHTKEISLWLAYNATPVRCLGLRSFVAQAAKVKVYIICGKSNDYTLQNAD